MTMLALINADLSRLIHVGGRLQPTWLRAGEGRQPRRLGRVPTGPGKPWWLASCTGFGALPRRYP